MEKENNDELSHFVMPQRDTEALKAREQETEALFDKVVSITEAAKINKVTRQAIYVAIKQKKLKARKHMARWVIHLEDLAAYRAQKYSRARSTFNGELLFDNENGYFSINQTAKMLSIPAQKVYYATRVGLLRAQRKGAAWVVHIDDIRGYRDSYLNSKKKKQLAAI